MKYRVPRFKNMASALKEMERFIKTGVDWQWGKRFEKFGDMRSREILANWLICATINAVEKRELTFTRDPIGSDGIVHDEATGETWPTEHVMVPRQSGGEEADAHALILAAIEQKRTKGGAAYASGKTLVVFLDAGAGEWYPNRVARALPDPLHFATVWVVGLQKIDDGNYVYGVTNLDVSNGDAPTFLVLINKDFDRWEVTDLQ